MNFLPPQRRTNLRPTFEFQRIDQQSYYQQNNRPNLPSLSINYNKNKNNQNPSIKNPPKNNSSSSSVNLGRNSFQNQSKPAVSSSYNGNNKELSVEKSKHSKTGRKLDTLFLVDVLCTSKFEEFTEIVASSQNLVEIDLRDLKQLRFLQKADFSDNHLPLEPFSVLQNLEELDISCNGLKTFDFDKCENEYMDLDEDGRAWNSLHTLNLSHNNCSNMISSLQLIPCLTNLNLSYNSLSILPSNLMYFTCLSTLDLSNNHLNSDSSLFSLATIPALQILNLDNNGIIRIPKFLYGFEALNKISLKNNKFEEPDDFDSLADILSLQEVNIIGNPITTKGNKYISESKKTFSNAKIILICDPPAKNLKSSLPGNVKTVPLDPLTLPFFSKAHKRALTDSQGGKNPSGNTKVAPMQPQQNENPSADDIFMTSFLSKTDDKPETKQSKVENIGFSIPPTQLPQYDDDESINTNIWTEIPLIQKERRRRLNPRIRSDYNRAFNQLMFIVNNPEAKISSSDFTPIPYQSNRNVNKSEKSDFRLNIATPKSGNEKINKETKSKDENEVFNNEEFLLKNNFPYSMQYNEGDEIDEIQDLIEQRELDKLTKEARKVTPKTRLCGYHVHEPQTCRRESHRNSQRSQRSNSSKDKITKQEIDGILENMDEELLNAEKEFQLADQYKHLNHNNEEEDADDNDNEDRFTKLHKQYEIIRADLLKTLNS